MTCKIERVVSPDGFVILLVSGRISGAAVEILRESIEKEKTTQNNVAIDLTEVTLVGPDAIQLLAITQAKGTELRNCPAYIRHWVSRAFK
jgi:anti-anti-sigma regulatory factor